MPAKKIIKLLILFLFIGSCQLCRTKKSSFSFVPVFESYGVDKKSVEHLGREVFFEDKDFFGLKRFGNSRIFKHTLQKPVRCRQGTIVEFGSCLEALACKTRLWAFEITGEEHRKLFLDSSVTDYSNYQLTQGIRTIKFDQHEQLLVVKEYDSINKKLTHILITGYDCFVTETEITGKYKEKNYTTFYSADISSSDLRDFSSPLDYIWARKNGYSKLEY